MTNLGRICSGVEGHMLRLFLLPFGFFSAVWNPSSLDYSNLKMNTRKNVLVLSVKNKF